MATNGYDSDITYDEVMPDDDNDSSKKKFELVLVEWLDSRQAEPEWMRLKDVTVNPCKCFSTGWLVYQDDDCIGLAQCVADYDDESPQVSGLLAIARCAVQSIVPYGHSLMMNIADKENENGNPNP